MKKILTLQWIPCEERLPDNNDYIMLSFENYSLPEIGRYEENLEGGAFYIGNENITCISKGFCQRLDAATNAIHKRKIKIVRR